MNPFKSLRSSIREELKTEHPFPPFLDQAADLFKKVHIFYRSFKFALIHHHAAKNSNKGHPAIYGAALQLMGDYTTIGSYALKVALVTKCTQDLLQEYRQLSTSYQKLRQTLTWQYPIYHHVEWKRNNSASLGVISPSLYLIFHTRLVRFVKHIRKIMRCVLEVFKQTFKLSMALADAQLLFNGDSQMRYEACTELVAKWENYQKKLKDNQQELVEEIQKNSQLADRLLKKMGVKNDCKIINEQLKKSLQSGMKNTKGVFNGLSETFKETLDTFYVKGKITALNIDLYSGKTAAPALPEGRFPPWAGQTVILNLDKMPQKLKKSKTHGLPIGKVSSLTEQTLKSFSYLKNCAQQFYQDEIENPEGISPFA